MLLSSLYTAMLLAEGAIVLVHCYYLLHSVLVVLYDNSLTWISSIIMCKHD